MTDLEAIRAMFASRLADDEEARGRQITAHTEVREAFTDLAMALTELLPEGDFKRAAFSRLQEAAMWANKAVASPYPVVPAHKEGRQSLEAERLQIGTQGQNTAETYGQYLDRTRRELAESATGVEIADLSEWGKTAETTRGRIDESEERKFS